MIINLKYYCYTTIELEKGDILMNAMQMLESILNASKMNSTYKLGLLTSVVDFIIENPIEPQQNNFHFIPTFYLAKQFLAYYFPLIINDVKQVPKKEKVQFVKIRPKILKLIESEKEKKELPFPLITENTNKLMFFIKENNILPKKVVQLLFDIRSIIIDQPMRYIRNIKSEKVSIFGLLSNDINFQDIYDKHLESGKDLKWANNKNLKNWDELLNTENLFLFFGHQTYTEISSFRFWLRDVLIKRWAQLCNESYNDVQKSLLSYFDLWKETPNRDSALIKKYRTLYLENGLRSCIYCNKSVNENLELDHFLPWSKYPVNGFWNLYPSCSKCNSSKTNKIPIMTPKRKLRIRSHLETCLELSYKKSNLIKHDFNDLYSRKFKSKFSEVSPDKVVDQIIVYITDITNNLLASLPGQEF